MTRVICECGQPAVRQGGYWVCNNPACEGYGQVCRAVREDE